MAFRLNERIRETVSTTGTGLVINLDGATLQCRNFADGLSLVSNGDTATTNYVLLSGDGVGWETGICTVTKGTPNTLSRDTIKFSTNSNARINLSGISKAFVIEPTLDSAGLDSVFGTTVGGVLVRGVAGWKTVSAGVSGNSFLMGGIGVDPTWNSMSGALDNSVGSTQGNIIYRAAGSWTTLPHGTAGQVLQTNGNLTNPTWANRALATDVDVAITSPADDDILVYVAATSKWTNHRPKYVIAAFVPGVLTASQNILFHRFAKPVTIPANFGAYLGLTSQAGGSANATASTVINVDKAPTATPNTFSNVGTITIAAGTVTPTLASSGGAAISFAAGDVLRMQGPATPDATFAGFHATLVGYET